MSLAYVPMGGLDFSLKPPKAIRKAVANIAQKLGIKATVSTPAGPVTVDTSKPDTIQTVKDMAANVLRNTTVTIGQKPEAASVPEQANDFVTTQVPGGWLTIGAVGLVGLIAVARMAKSR